MKLHRTCKVCGNAFTAIKVTQYFCCRSCFKREFYQRTKEKQKAEERSPEFPLKKCDFCKETSRLSFDPLASPQLFNAWGCPHCHATNKLIWEHQDKYDSYQVIQQVLIQITAGSQTINIQQVEYQTYQIPIQPLEQGNQSIIVMPCGTLNIADLQRGDRKKITFS